jgi:CelD/BcsL family acetyltransferase involved in cellulose biosynthesis
MTLAAAIETRTADKPVWSTESRIASVDILVDLGQAETAWRSLEPPRHFATPYQRFDFLLPWQRQVGSREGRRPYVIIAYDGERRPLLLLPLAIRQESGIRVANFMGGKHATFNMALWDSDFAMTANTTDLEALISAIRDRSEAADVLALHRQPLKWHDKRNPMALLPHQTSVNDCPVMMLVSGAPLAERVSQSLRGRLKGKERKLKSLSGYRYYIAAEDADIIRLMDAFFRIKPQRMAEQDLPNVFEEPGVEDFIRDACMKRLENGERAIQIHALECDDEVIAIFAGVADGDRFSMMFNTYTVSGNSRHSPGLILIRHIVDYYAERGYRTLDLGVGSDGYKRLFCKDDEPIFDCFIPLSLRGTVAAVAMAGLNRTKYLVKRSPALLQAAHRLRRAIRR